MSNETEDRGANEALGEAGEIVEVAAKLGETCASADLCLSLAASIVGRARALNQAHRDEQSGVPVLRAGGGLR